MSLHRQSNVGLRLHSPWEAAGLRMLQTRQFKFSLPGENGNSQGCACGNRTGRPSSHPLCLSEPGCRIPGRWSMLPLLWGFIWCDTLLGGLLFVCYYSINLEELRRILLDPETIPGARKRQTIGSLLSRNPSSKARIRRAKGHIRYATV